MIDGYQVLTDPQTGDTYVQYDPMPYAGPNIGYAWGGAYDVVQGGKLQVDAPGVLAGAVPGSQDSGPVTVGSIIEQPQHGSLDMNNSTGAFTYTPNADFSGLDWFTWQVADGSGPGGYASVFINVQPLTPTISIGDLKEGDPTAQVPNIQFPQDANGDPQYATINLNPGASLPNGSTVTLSVNSDVQNDLDIYDGIPGQSGSNLLLGKDAGTDTYTWTISDTQAVPSVVYEVGLVGTGYDQVQMTLSVDVGTTEYGSFGDNSPDASPTTQPSSQPSATQPETVQGKGAFLEAFDGTWDYPKSPTPTIIYQFYSQHFTIDAQQDNAKYHQGPGAEDKALVGKTGDAFDKAVDELAAHLNGALAADQAKWLANTGITEIQSFYSDPKNAGVPLDIIGYSRGAFEALKLADEAATGILNLASKKTRGALASFTREEIPLKFVGLISPVGMMGVVPPGSQSDTSVGGDSDWPTNLMSEWAYFYQALDGSPNNWPYMQTKVTTSAPTQDLSSKPWQDNHHTIGVDGKVLDQLLAAAKLAKLPVK